jgi:hypothetical protein
LTGSSTVLRLLPPIAEEDISCFVDPWPFRSGY